MKVLWITHDVLDIFYPFVEGRPTLGSTWLDSLYLELKINPKLELSILTPIIGGKSQKLHLDNVTFYTIRLEKNSKSFFTNEMSSRYIEQINDFNPDIIHIHGTENNYAYALFDCGVEDDHYLSEDWLFCNRWKKIGGSIWLDVSINLTHTGVENFNGCFISSIL